MKVDGCDVVSPRKYGLIRVLVLRTPVKRCEYSGLCLAEATSGLYVMSRVDESEVSKSEKE